MLRTLMVARPEALSDLKGYRVDEFRQLTILTSLRGSLANKSEYSGLHAGSILSKRLARDCMSASRLLMWMQESSSAS